MSLAKTVRRVTAQLAGIVAAVSAMTDFRRNRPIDKKDWHRILGAHCVSNGWFTDLLNPALRLLNPPRPAANASGLLGHFTVDDQKRIATEIARDGFYIFDAPMPEQVLDAIEHFARNAKAGVYGDVGHVMDAVYDPAQPRARLYKFAESDSVTDTGVQAVMADDALMRIAETYLETQTVVGGIDTWWSAPYGNGPSGEAAQMFHFDFDAPPRWLKLFVYVTPVGAGNGPHVYVKGSHRAGKAGAAKIIARGYERITDQDIDQAYGAGAVTEITGERGTVFLADTRGFHKGKYPSGGDRLICQLLYCSPVFSDRPRTIPHQARLSPPLARAMAENPAAYQRYAT